MLVATLAAQRACWMILELDRLLGRPHADGALCDGGLRARGDPAHVEWSSTAEAARTCVASTAVRYLVEFFTVLTLFEKSLSGIAAGVT